MKQTPNRQHMRQLRTFVNEAIKEDIFSQTIIHLGKYPIKTTPSKHSFLLPEEARKLEKLELSSCPKSLLRLKRFILLLHGEFDIQTCTS